MVAGFLITGIVGINALTVSGEGPSTDQPVVAVGTLVLDVPGGDGRTGTVKYFAAGNKTAEADAVQTISASGPCETITNTGAPLLRIDTTPPDSRPVLPNDGLGILTGNQNCGTAGVIDRNESMVLSLDEFFVDEFFVDDVYVSTTDLVVFRPDNQGGNLTVGIDEGDLKRVSPDLVNGLNERTVNGFKHELAVSSTSPRFNKGIYLRGATFHLVAPAPATAPDAPTDVTGVAGNGQVDVSWKAPTDDGGSAIIDYIVEYREGDTGDNWTPFADDVSTTTSATVTGLTNGTEYTFRVAAVNEVGTGEFSVPSEPVTPRPSADITGRVDCGESLSVADEIDDVDLIAGTGTFERLANGTAKGGDPEDGCELIDVTISITEGFVFWDNDESGQDVQALFTIEWAGVLAEGYET
ncbi:MAG: fibronectin type III domain-containing protein, partial [Ilumatobacter sp.]